MKEIYVSKLFYKSIKFTVLLAFIIAMSLHLVGEKIDFPYIQMVIGMSSGIYIFTVYLDQSNKYYNRKEYYELDAYFEPFKDKGILRFEIWQGQVAETGRVEDPRLLDIQYAKTFEDAVIKYYKANDLSLDTLAKVHDRQMHDYDSFFPSEEESWFKNRNGV